MSDVAYWEAQESHIWDESYMSTFEVRNSRGRILMRVTSTFLRLDGKTMYSYDGDGMSGTQNCEGIWRAARYLMIDVKSARIYIDGKVIA